MGYPVNGHHIVAVDGDAGQAIALRFLGEVFPAAARAGRIYPAIIFDDKDYGQAMAGGECERLMPGAACGDCLAGKSDHNGGIFFSLVG